MSTVELLAPAGNPEALDAALGEGADAVYLGLRSFNARMRSANFAFNQFEAAVEVCHKNHKKIFVTVNTVFEQREADRMFQLLQYLERVGPDGIIVQDLGVVKMAKDYFPGLKLHASTQMNIGSARGANFLSRHGFKRVVLSRELSLDEIRKVREGTNLEIETFVHGALCVSASGLCLFSSYLGGKSANRGLCAQACRRIYTTERQNGYFFSPDDLQLVAQVPELVEAGVDSLKIEGRMKSAEYVGAVVAAYRHMLDNWRLDREKALAKSLSILQQDFARQKTTFNISGERSLDFLRPEQPGGTGIRLGKVKDIRAFDDGRWALLDGEAAGLQEGDSLRIHRADDSSRFTAKLRGVKDSPKGRLVKIDGSIVQGDEVYLVQTKVMGKRWKPVLPKDVGRYHKFPSRDEAPRPEYPRMEKSELEALPDGIYSLVGRVADLHVLLAARPEKAMIHFDRKTAEGLRRHEKELPFKRDSLVFWLDPYLAEADSDWLAEELEYWIGRGQRFFVANNLAHLGLLRGRNEKGAGLVITAGPWLYSFNRYASSFLLQEGARCVVPPFEISKQDFMKVAEAVPAKALMPVVFSYPPLFRIRADLAKKYDFKDFADRDGTVYDLRTGEDYSTVIPRTPYSLVDRVPFLKKEGIGKFILDFSQIELPKPLYKQVFKAAEEGRVLPETGRFNWKEGFWQPPEAPSVD
ncbi:MAG: U32 family peptidase [Spirochaetaceae bacterium]|nr:U32 family peptidase [Spirochaetaceae bacterium]